MPAKCHAFCENTTFLKIILLKGDTWKELSTFVGHKQQFILETMVNKAIITVVGKDTVGIIAQVCTYLAENKVNILDISQTIVQEYFTMMMIVDMTKLEKPFEQVVGELTNIGSGIGVQIKCQREEIFDKMHRI